MDISDHFPTYCIANYLPIMDIFSHFSSNVDIYLALREYMF